MMPSLSIPVNTSVDSRQHLLNNQLFSNQQNPTFLPLQHFQQQQQFNQSLPIIQPPQLTQQLTSNSFTPSPTSTYVDDNLLLNVLSKVLERLIDLNSSVSFLFLYWLLHLFITSFVQVNSQLTKFHSSSKPDVTIFNYLERIK